MSDYTRTTLSAAHGTVRRPSLLLSSLLVGLLGAGTAIAETSAPGGYPAWAQPAAPSVPASGREGSAPPPGPYAAAPAGQAGAGFAPPVAPGWQAPPPRNAGGMTREEFQKQQAERRAAMEQRMGQMQGQGAQWPTPEQRQEEMQQRMAAMHQQQPQWPQGMPSDEDRQKHRAEMQAQHDARWKQIEQRQQEMQQQWEQMQSRQREMQQQFEQMRQEHYAQMQGRNATGSTEQNTTAPAQSAPAPTTQAMPQGPGYGYPPPYGYAPWQNRGYPYGPGR